MDSIAIQLEPTEKSANCRAKQHPIQVKLTLANNYPNPRAAAMSIVRRSSVFDPFSLDLWADPFDTFRSFIPALGNSETAAFANAHVDWKETPEAHVFKADLPGVKKEEVKVEVEDGNMLVVVSAPRRTLVKKGSYVQDL
jgi:HSP20 family molecular chaperone IbpA